MQFNANADPNDERRNRISEVTKAELLGPVSNSEEARREASDCTRESRRPDFWVQSGESYQFPVDMDPSSTVLSLKRVLFDTLRLHSIQGITPEQIDIFLQGSEDRLLGAADKLHRHQVYCYRVPACSP